MRLRHAPTSPFVRKVRVAAIELGLDGEIELAPTDVWDPGSDIASDNPLGKVPALVTDEGTFVDSLLICQYLDAKGGRRLFPPLGQGWDVLRLYTLADGLIEAAVNRTIETLRRPREMVFDGFVARHEDKINRTLDMIEASGADPDTVDIATITLGCALGYLDFRCADLEWRKGRPRLAAFDERFGARPSMQATQPPGSA